MNCPKCNIELVCGGFILATELNKGECYCVGNPSADRIAPCYKCPKCGFSEMEKNPDCANCGKPTKAPIYWCGTSARCCECHTKRITEE